jgi:nitroimidazol reductase NimA-like FMN-containing flavoprotein (pyridoxamine 5'-phosphate oxidase superfamily)
MPKDYLNQPYNEIRRKDRGKDEAWIKAFLKRAPFCVLALSHQDQPFINSNLFVYDEAQHAIYLHNAYVGRTPATVAANPRVCFHTFEMGQLLPADKAIDSSVEYAGVTIFGQCHLIDDEIEAKFGLQMLLDKYFPHLKPVRDYGPIRAQDLKRTAVLRIDIESWSGKEKKVEGNPPGAFYYGEI